MFSTLTALALGIYYLCIKTTKFVLETLTTPITQLYVASVIAAADGLAGILTCPIQHQYLALGPIYDALSTTNNEIATDLTISEISPNDYLCSLVLYYSQSYEKPEPWTLIVARKLAVPVAWMARTMDTTSSHLSYGLTWWPYIVTLWVIVVTIAVKAYGERWSTWLRHQLNLILTKANDVRVTSYDRIRNAFRCTPVFNITQGKGEHPACAAGRSAAITAIDSFCKSIGMRSYCWQSSRVDEQHGRQGYRSHYWSKDLLVDPKMDPIESDHIITLVDVDFYLDDTADVSLVELLGLTNNPVMIYTTTPTAVASDDDELKFHFNDENEYCATYAGGSTFKHQLFDYSRDTVSHSFRRGLNVVTTAHSVVRMTLSKHRSIVLLIPLHRSYGFINRFIYQLMVGIEPLLRLAPVSRGVGGNYSLMTLQPPVGKTLVSIGLPGLNVSASITMAKFVEISALTHSKLPPTAAAIATHLGNVEDCGDNCREPASVIYMAMMRGCTASSAAPCVTDAVTPSHSYQFVHTRTVVDLSATPAQTAFMKPIVDGAFVPASCKPNDQQAVKARITDICHKVEMSGPQHKFIDEFVAHLFPEPGMLTPVDFEVVHDKLRRPTQRALFAEAMGIGANELHEIRSFMKAESYAKLGDPRVISTTPVLIKTLYSTITLALGSHAKKWDWYAFGLTPAQISARVTEVLMKTREHVVETDFSRFDGRISSVIRELESKILTRAFAKEFHAFIDACHSKQWGCKARSRHKVSYRTFWTRLSGSPETSIFNSLVNAYIAYAALRIAYPDKSPAACYEMLGIYGGDDGLTSDIDPKVYTNVALSYGLTLTSEKKQRGKLVKFLARLYGPGSWNGDATSCCDMLRQLNKFHLGQITPGMTPSQKLLAKAQSFYVTDSGTPIIGVLARHAMRLCDAAGVLTTHPDAELLKSWHSFFESDGERFPNERAAWMETACAEQMPGVDIAAYETQILSCTSVEQLLTLDPAWDPPEPKPATVTVYVDGDLKLGTKPTVDPTICRNGDKCRFKNDKLGNACRFKHPAASLPPKPKTPIAKSPKVDVKPHPKTKPAPTANAVVLPVHLQAHNNQKHKTVQIQRRTKAAPKGRGKK